MYHPFNIVICVKQCEIKLKMSNHISAKEWLRFNELLFPDFHLRSLIHSPNQWQITYITSCFCCVSPASLQASRWSLNCLLDTPLKSIMCPLCVLLVGLFSYEVGDGSFWLQSLIRLRWGQTLKRKAAVIPEAAGLFVTPQCLFNHPLGDKCLQLPSGLILIRWD